MNFITETIHKIFLKPEKQNLELNEEQRKKYRKQYLTTTITATLTTLTLIYGLGTAIIQFLTTGHLINLALAVVFGLTIETILRRTTNQILIIEERIQKRHIKNLKQKKRANQNQQKTTTTNEAQNNETNKK